MRPSVICILQLVRTIVGVDLAHLQTLEERDGSWRNSPETWQEHADGTAGGLEMCENDLTEFGGQGHDVEDLLARFFFAFALVVGFLGADLRWCHAVQGVVVDCLGDEFADAPRVDAAAGERRAWDDRPSRGGRVGRRVEGGRGRVGRGARGRGRAAGCRGAGIRAAAGRARGHGRVININVSFSMGFFF